MSNSEHCKWHAEHRLDGVNEKISQTLSGRKLSEETKMKMSKPKSEEHRKNISKAFKGRHWKLIDGKRVWY